jgi:hypothetical protein
MGLIVDIVLNNLVAVIPDTSDASLATAAGGNLLFKQSSDYHSRCGIAWTNHTSEVSGSTAGNDISDARSNNVGSQQGITRKMIRVSWT